MKKRFLRIMSAVLVLLIILSTASCAQQRPVQITDSEKDIPNITTNEVTITTDPSETEDNNTGLGADTDTDLDSDTDTDLGKTETEKESSEPTHICQSENRDHICDQCGITFEVCNDFDKNHFCDVCGVRLLACADANNDHKCDVCDAELSLCIDTNTDHKCDICNVKLNDCKDTNNNHKCDICNGTLSECADTDNNHKCDICDNVLSNCEDKDNNHNCDICDNVLSECEDKDNNHKCDTCGATLSECEDKDKNHMCDTCDATLSECEDKDNNHNCDTCGATLSNCEDKDNNHKCDICDNVLSECEDKDNNHNCDTCGATLSNCGDKDKNHKCDTCDNVLSNCEDKDSNHKCDTCGATLSECEDKDKNHKCDICDNVLSNCEDKDSNHKCDTCDNVLSECEDKDSNHKCDTCDNVLSNCEDKDNNHKCDTCDNVLSECEDKDNNHNCDTCGATLSNCEDKDNNHKCDICDNVLSECEDKDNNHKCDTCDATLSECEDKDNNHNCDTCDATLSNCEDKDSNHKCDICDNVLSECEDKDKNHMCDTCDATLSNCEDKDNNHKCDTCDNVLSECADTDKNHKCDVCEASMNMDKHSDVANDGNHFCDYGCGAKLTDCADANKDHKCDECSATISECTDSDANHKCDTCGTTTSQHFDNATDGNHACDYSGCQAIIISCSDSDRNYVCDDCKANITLPLFANGAYNIKFICGSSASDFDKKIYNEICALFKSKTGVAISTAAEGYTGPAVIIGSTTYAESKSEMARLNYGDAAANIIGNKYVITYSNPVAAAKMVTALRNLLSSKSATTLTADKSWAISITDAASRVNQTFDSTGIVSSATLPKYNGAALPTPLYAGQQSYIYTNKNATLQHFDNYCAALHVAGFKYYTNNQIGDNQFATYVTNTQIINVMYFKATAEVRITTDVRGTGTNAFDLPKLSGENTYSKTKTPAFTMVEIDNTGYGGGMCFIFRLSNGKFFVVDSGINKQGSYTSSAKWIYNTLYKLAGEPADGKIVVQGWLITHIHSDHIGGLYDMAKDSSITSKLTIEQLIHNEPTDDITKELEGLTDSSANKIWTWMNTIINGFGIKSVVKAHPGQVFHFADAKVNVLISQDAVLEKKADMKNTNELSVVTQIEFNGKKILMLGDALKIENNFLATVYGKNLKSDILQAAHHGLNDTGADTAAGNPDGVNQLCAPSITLFASGYDSVAGGDKLEYVTKRASVNNYLMANTTWYGAKNGNLTFYIYSDTLWSPKQPSPSW